MVDGILQIHSEFRVMHIKDMEKPKVDLGLLEEDDEFEEFPTENWGPEQLDNEDVSVWEDNWEDDVIQDDFNKQLKIQIEKMKEQNKEAK